MKTLPICIPQPAACNHQNFCVVAAKMEITANSGFLPKRVTNLIALPKPPGFGTHHGEGESRLVHR